MIRYFKMRKFLCRHRPGMMVSLMILLCWPVSSASASMDLQVESVRIQPARPAASDPMTVYAILKNSGSEPVFNFYVSVNIYQSGKLMKQVEDIPVLSELPRSGIGLSVPVEIGNFQEGEYKIEFFVDSRNQITETSEDNNSKAVPLRVYAAPKSVNKKWQAGSTY